LDVLYITKTVKYDDKMQNIKSATECADTPNHMRSNHTNMAEYSGLRWQISMPMIRLLWHE